MATVMAQEIISNFVGGRFVPGSAARVLLDVNPSDGADVVARVPEGGPEDAAAAVHAATVALDRWRRQTGPARAEHLHRWAAAIDARREEVALTLVREVGKPIGEARGEVGRCVVILRYYAGEAVRATGEVIPAQAEGVLQFTLRDPLGVVALITPWNFPLAIPLWKAAPALAFGNTVVLKPSEQAAASARLLAETAAQAGLPDGVFNVVNGTGAMVGEALVGDAMVRGVSFTGSSAAGVKVAALAVERNITYQLEMGGKNVVLVAADADLDLAARLTAAGAMRFAGQKCTATSRVIVDRRVEESFLAKLATEVAALSLGPVDQPSAAVGPLISEAARERVARAVSGAEGRLLCGGHTPLGEPFQRGFFYAPTVIHDVDPGSSLAQDEIFGPVLAVFRADGMDDALALANRTRFGLSASLFTRDLGAALSYVQRIEVGLVRVNGDTTGVDPHAPFGGLKGSSSGSREQGSAAREFYTETRTVQLHP